MSYMSKCLLGKPNKARAFHLRYVLESFAAPYDDRSAKAMLVLSVARAKKLGG